MNVPQSSHDLLEPARMKTMTSLEKSEVEESLRPFAGPIETYGSAEIVDGQTKAVDPNPGQKTVDASLKERKADLAPQGFVRQTEPG